MPGWDDGSYLQDSAGAATGICCWHCCTCSAAVHAGSLRCAVCIKVTTVLPCPPHPALQSPQEVAATPPPARLAFLQSLQRLLAGSAHQHTKLAVLAYLESLAVDMATSHELINSDLCIFMVGSAWGPQGSRMYTRAVLP